MFWRQVVADAREIEAGVQSPPSIESAITETFRGNWSGHERNVFFHNADGDSFVEMGYSVGLDHDDDGRAVAPLDVDGDGDLDLAVLNLRGLRLLMNTAPPRHFARLRLIATSSHPSALGARVKITTADATQQDIVKATTGFATQVPLDLHFGLKDADRIERLTVQWPGGAVETFEDLPADWLLIVREGSDRVEKTKLPSWPAESRPHRIPPFPRDLPARRLSGGIAPLRAEPGPAVIHFWTPKDQQLSLLTRLNGGTQAVGVCVDPTDMDSVRRTLTIANAGFPQFVANKNLMRAVFWPSGDPPIPMTLVLDDAGQVKRAFYRAVSQDELEAVVGSLGAGRLEEDHWALGKRQLRQGHIEAGSRNFERAIELNPDLPHLHYFIGLVRTLQNRPDEATKAFERAVALDPTYVQAHISLGIAHSNANRLLEAERALNEALRLAPDRPKPHAALGMTFLKSGRHQKAVEHFEKAIAGGLEKAGLRIALGRAHMELGNRKDAAAQFRRTLEIDPKNREARELLDKITGSEPDRRSE